MLSLGCTRWVPVRQIRYLSPLLLLIPVLFIFNNGYDLVCDVGCWSDNRTAVSSETNFTSKNHKHTLREEPKTRFIYLAVHKTGSTNLRKVLRKFCSVQHKLCLTYAECEKRYYRMSQCLNSLANKPGPLTFTFTSERVQQCCPLFKSGWNGRVLDAVVEHYHMGSRENQRFIRLSPSIKSPITQLRINCSMFREHTASDAFRFTMVRNPFNLFYSYYQFLNVKEYAFGEKLGRLPPFADLVEMLYQRHVLGMAVNSPLTFNLDWVDTLLVNSQSRELGFIPELGNLHEVVNDIETKLDFVILSEYSRTGIEILLKEKLHWPGYYEWFLSNIEQLESVSHVDEMDHQTRQRLKALLYADLTMYAAAQRRFFADVEKSKYTLDPKNVADETWTWPFANETD